ncbi:ShlB/FhaC/HecB family hemolysin secretion/activation protein [Cronbergia sp. UHCC 0137]|uniref:ShlB/FhaC/HecB family hemolysin secretion/activation protein n=1 Tax=Cronbergia sp. UHCC 0137 TaxID=3110239 RepID=UPI002B1EFFFA|nr:ShlB/FhaC/HecB family hemolysin secretion/activation protein [Cronbergia sp. UHCC 0137]MEA5621280.1 ShlB/FhaC/HecB family hemolysin secretion/activation protein [Cronbergia sp. UHCC 0137]
MLCQCITMGLLGILTMIPVQAQTPNTLPPRSPTPEAPVPLPPLEELLPQPNIPIPNQELFLVPGNITINRFVVEGSTLFTAEELAKITAPFTGHPITFTEMVRAAGAIAQLYIDRGYVTSGAFIPANQTFNRLGATVKIQVVEGQLSAIQIKKIGRLDPNYIRDRLAMSGSQPLNINRLIEKLQLLQLDPLIQNISAELTAGSNPGESVLNVAVVEADSFSTSVDLDNTRSPSVGEVKGGIRLQEGNLLGFGDRINLGYSDTEGSNTLETSYILPLNPQNGSLRLAYNTTSSEVIESAFRQLNITAASRSYEITLRQPLIQTPSQEFAIGLSGTRKESETSLLGLKFPLSPGADNQGSTRISALRFFQEFTSRNQRSVIALRSQFNLGVGWLNSTWNNNPPDSNFFTWQGQAQYVKLLAPDSLLLLRADAQLADRPLVALEQFGLGGSDSVRGYRQNFLLHDNGVFSTAELRLPIARISANGVLQLTPFVDFGTGWSNSSSSAMNTLASAGLGLLWRQGNTLTARLDWGIPLVSTSGSQETWQEKGIYFSLVYSPF